MNTEELYSLFAEAHFRLSAVYDAIPRWLNDESQISADDLAALRDISTANSLMAKDLETDIDALLEDMPADPVEVALTHVRDAIEMLRDGTRVVARIEAFHDALVVIDGIMAKHGYETPADFRSAGNVRKLVASIEQQARETVVGVREDGRQEAPRSSSFLVETPHPDSDPARRETPRAWNEPATSREPEEKVAVKVLYAKSCGICGAPTDPSDFGRCETCFMLEL